MVSTVHSGPQPSPPPTSTSLIVGYMYPAILLFHSSSNCVTIYLVALFKRRDCHARVVKMANTKTAATFWLLECEEKVFCSI